MPPKQNNSWVYALLITAGLWWATQGKGCDLTPLPPSPPAPIAIQGLRAMIVEDLLARADYPVEKFNIVMSTKPGSFRDFLNKNAVKNARGEPDILIGISVDADLSQMPQYWQDAHKLATSKNIPPPILLISNGKHGYLGPLPKDTAATLAIIQPLVEK